MKRNLICCCCGGSAGKWEQHWNRDTGYGVCVKCVAWARSRGESEDEIKSLYGVEGKNWGDKPQETVREELREEQAKRVIPLIGPLLDAWEGLDNSFKSEICDLYPTLHDALQNIYRAVESE